MIHNDTIWWDIVKSLQLKYARKNISTQDVLSLMNEKSKMDLSAIFHQYLNVASLAKLNVQLKTSKSGLNVSYSWDCATKDFDMPITIFIKGKAVIIQPKANEQNLFYANTAIKDLVFDGTGYYYQLNLK